MLTYIYAFLLIQSNLGRLPRLLPFPLLPLLCLFHHSKSLVSRPLCTALPSPTLVRAIPLCWRDSSIVVAELDTGKADRLRSTQVALRKDGPCRVGLRDEDRVRGRAGVGVGRRLGMARDVGCVGMRLDISFCVSRLDVLISGQQVKAERTHLDDSPDSPGRPLTHSMSIRLFPLPRHLGIFDHNLSPWSRLDDRYRVVLSRR